MHPPPTARSRSAWKKRLLLIAGLLLAAMAVHQAWQPAAIQAVARQFGSLAGWLTLLEMALLSLASLWLTALLFWLVHRGFPAQPPVDFPTMRRLIQASALVNYLPLGWPGPVARSAYLKWRHAMPVRQSMLAMAAVWGVSSLAAAMVVVSRIGQATPGLGWVVVTGIALWIVIARIVRWRFVRRWPGFFLTLPVKLLDLAVSAIRLKLAFGLLGQPLGLADALLLAAPETVVSMLSPTPSGLGVSEWTVGGLAGWLQLASSPIAAAAKLLDRALSLLILLPLGVGSLRRLMRNAPPG